MHFVYILELSDGRYYIGQTQDVAKRYARHQSGQNRYTRPYRPLKLIYNEPAASRTEAIKRERYLKSLKSHKEIEKLIKGMAPSSSG